MKKVILTGFVATFTLILSSCGGGGGHGGCDAFHKSDYTKYKADQTKKIEVNIRKK
jgi:hypothetical protein